MPLFLAGKEPMVPTEKQDGWIPEPVWTIWRTEGPLVVAWNQPLLLACPSRSLVTVLTELCTLTWTNRDFQRTPRQRSFLMPHALNYGSPNFYGKGPHLSLWAGSRAASGKITVNSTPNSLTYCVIFILYAWFTNVVAGRTIQPGEPHAARGPRVGFDALNRRNTPSPWRAVLATALG
jgi:hypothetical protein